MLAPTAASGASLPGYFTPAQAGPGVLPPGHPTLAPQHPLGAPLPGPPAAASQANLGALLRAPLPDFERIAQQAAQAAVQQAWAQALSVQVPAVLQPGAPAPSNLPSTTTTWVYQPPAAPAETVTALQASLAARAVAPGLAGTSSPHFASLSGNIPSIPSKYMAAAAAGEFVDFNELLHAIDAEGGEEPPLLLQVVEGQHLSLPTRPKRRVVSTFGEWVRCFSVYASTLCAYQPLHGPDMLAYMFLMASAQQEFSFPACLAYDVAFRRKVGKFRPSTGASWTHSSTLRPSLAPARSEPPPTAPSASRPHTPRPAAPCTPRGRIPRPLYILAGQPRSRRPPRLAPSAQAHPKSCASTSTKGDAQRRTARGHTSAPSPAAVAPTQPAAAYSTASPREQPEHVLTILLPPHHPPPPPLVVTPVHVRTLAALLTHHPNPHFVNYLTTGFQFGFSTGHSGPQAAHRAPNLQSALAHPQVITDYLQQEGAAGHTTGPFSTPPLPNFIVSPLGAVPKKRSGKWRLIMHLSHPPGHSINNGIDIADFPLRYSTVYDAMDSVMHLGRHALMAKLDVKSAFRLCPVRPSEHHLLGMQWQGHFYFDRVLPFGLRSAPFIFNGLAEAVEWLARDRRVGHVHHYLDDFFLAGAPSTDECSQHLATVTSLCSALGIPLAKEKLAGPTTELEYLGILLDSAELEARLPPDKLHDIKSSLHQWTDRSQCSK